MFAQFFTLGSIICQLLFRMYLYFKLNTKEKSTEVLSTKVVSAIALVYIATSIFGKNFGITIGAVVFFLGKYLILALFTLFSHKTIWHQFLFQHLKLNILISNVVGAEITNQNVLNSISNSSMQQQSSQRRISDDQNISSPPEQIDLSIIHVQPARSLSPYPT